ncbi:unnamed protein product [Medioppia subpectinata]|uniref:Cathepsin L n=1 Tax=Medioppia subpectinata TaxID=1979941 RepID=A0A7R9QCJ1_9ACAR|nr:unnamed protein product [Medioppia subpectinata]CAG2118315.1 unnamed protein product [Medioppia subpectinata]
MVSVEEQSKRRQIFEKNYRFIVDHNRDADNGLHTYRLAVNQFADITHEEYLQRFALHSRPTFGKRMESKGKTVINSIANELPISVDWRDKHVVTRVKDQLDVCNKSYLSQLALKTGNLTELSVQNVADCIYPGKLHDLNCFIGGYMHEAYEVIMKYGGVEADITSPYKAYSYNCSYREEYRRAAITGYVNVTTGDERALQEAVARVGPVAIGVDASQETFKFYKSGVYVEPKCKNGFKDLHHAMVVVGYGADNGVDYWLMKNSWGLAYGDAGYIKMARNRDNQCGVATYALYPTGVH